MFDKPTPAGQSGDLFDQKAHVGSLLVVKVHEFIPDMVTKYMADGGPAIKADVTVINPDGTAGDEYQSTLLFGKVLTDQLRPSVGRVVLGILALGEAGTGKNAPYVLNEAPPAAEEAAVRAMTSKPAAAQQPATVAPQAQAPAANGWGAAPAQQAPAANGWGAAPAQQAPVAAAAGTPAPPWA